MADSIVHKTPGARDDTFPCCGAPLDPWAKHSPNDWEINCTGPNSRLNMDDLLRQRLAEALGAGMTAVEMPGSGNPPHGAPGHQCLPDDVVLDLGNTLEKIATLAQAQRDRLVEKGFDDVTAQGLAAHLHASLVKTILG